LGSLGITHENEPDHPIRMWGFQPEPCSRSLPTAQQALRRRLSDEWLLLNQSS
jgi:hypothetical protein